MRTIITTVGTSLLNNRDGRPWSKDPLPDPAVVAAWLQDADPRRASAELHTWFRLGLFEQPTHERVRLIHSHTPDGQFCAERLRDYAQRHRLDAALVDITELHYTDTATFNRGLRQLVHVLAEQIRAARAQGEVALAATGGFKAEIAVANLVGALLDTPVYYIYEQFEHLIKLEPLPIALQGDWLRQGPGEKLLQTLAAEEIVPRQQVHSLLQADPRLELLLEAEEVGDQLHVAPNLLGEFAVQLFQTPPIGWPPECETPPMDKIQLEGTAHHRPTGWKETVNQIARNIYVRRIRYDAGAGQRTGLLPASDNHSDLYGVLNDGRDWLGLRIETTAENEAQRRRVLDYLRRQLRW
ncbi:MAG: putative CRISPR-associated protein [Candidatus Contendobacter sp.]|nr:putative CRISPR-associated protein [Candidatus Contendobacter sp.]MDG4557006.1 putative CRISPR-associated protein [Candidatus Contendobacter sp.]